MKAALDALPNKHARDSLKALGQDYTRRNSINFTNVRVNTQHDKPHFWNLSNFTFNYVYYETFRRNVTTEKELEKNYTGGIIYDYNTISPNIKPFQKIKFLNKPAFLIIRDFNFNLKPQRISLRTDMARSYMEITRRNIDNPNMKQDAQVNKNWLWGRNFDLQWDLASSLKFDFSAGNNARIDEPIGVVDRHMKDEYELWRDSVWTNIKNGGRITDYHHSFRASYTIPINKLPLLKWTSATASYTGDYMWGVAPIYAPIITDTDTTIFNPGNTINNRNNISLNGTLIFTTLYNKVPYFRNLGQPQRNPQQPQVEYKTVIYERGAINIDAGVPRSVTHNLNTRVVEVTLKDAEGKAVETNVQIVSDNRVILTTAIDVRRASVMVKGSIEKRVTNPSEFIVRNFTRILLGVKNVTVNYMQNGDTILPGYAMNSNMFGVSGSAPGLPFLLGWQDEKFPEKAIANNWLVQESQLNAAVAMTHTNSLTARLLFEPFTGMRVNFSAIRSFTENRTSYYIWDPTANNGAGGYPQNLRSPLTSGSYSISVIALRSAFEKHEPKHNYRSAVFDKFTENRSTVSSRRASELQKNNASYTPTPGADGGFDGYSLEAQEVMIPSFYAAYMGRSPEKVSLNDFPSFLYMLPNWDLDFSGLSNIPLIKKYFRSVSIRHTYKATYSVGSYATNQAFNADVATAASIARDLQNNFIPRNDIATASLDERFNPLIGIDMTFINSLSTRIQINKSRVVSLGLGNLQMSENNSSDYTISVGYVFNQVPLTIRTLDGDTKRLQSDLKVNADFSIRDSKTLIRRIGAIDETTQEQNILPVQASAGNKQMTLNLKASYNMSSNFTLSIYFDRIINTPFVSTSYKSYNTNFGFSMRFMLVQ
jgi:cell surface protein SprA